MELLVEGLEMKYSFAAILQAGEGKEEGARRLAVWFRT